MENDPMCGCNDAGCGWKGPARDLGCQIAQVEDFFERVAPGEIVPVGECPECGALAHLLGNNETLRTLAQEMVLIAAQLTDNDANKMFALLAHKFSELGTGRVQRWRWSTSKELLNAAMSPAPSDRDRGRRRSCERTDDDGAIQVPCNVGSRTRQACRIVSAGGVLGKRT